MVNPDGARRMTVAVCIALLVGVAAVRAWPSTHDLIDHWSHRARSHYERVTAGGRAIRADAAFTEWARARVRGHGPYWIESPAVRADPGRNQWLTFRLLPEVEAARPAQANALIWYGEQRPVRIPPGFGAPAVYGPGAAIAVKTAP